MYTCMYVCIYIYINAVGPAEGRRPAGGREAGRHNRRGGDDITESHN